AQHGAHEVDANGELPIVPIHILDQAKRAVYASVAHQDVESTEHTFGMAHQLCHLILLRNISSVRHDLNVAWRRGYNLVNRQVKRCGLTGIQYDMRPVLRETTGNR